MSAFSRGCLLRSQFLMRPVQPLPSTQFSSQQSRFFSASPLFRTVKNTRTKPSKKPLPLQSKDTSSIAKHALKPAPKSFQNFQNYQNFATTLALRDGPTPLYKAPSHTLLKSASFVGGFSFLIWSGYCFTTYYNPGIEDASDLLRYSFAFGGFICLILGGALATSSIGIIRSITAFPKHLSPALKMAGKEAQLQAAKGTPELQIEIEIKKFFPIPFFPARKLYTRPDEILLRAPLGTRSVAMMGVAERQRFQVMEEQMYRDREQQMISFWRAPIQKTSRFFFALFLASRRAWTREGFIGVQVKHRSYGVDISEGWFLENGRALDRLMKIKPS